ncbi:molybdenum cofactor sulfurase 3 [Episyrphus balteatus]|uniref:molybdenum cofactor sulfurase 3 n=1 Tax=Episyrphus balteatus TaxID=286459 RepID=UPI00248547FF|nr:molybdenum cofactor sulfurase 3 [Episyrphus balteatus]
MTQFIEEFSSDEVELISREFKRLGENTYLDHAGTTLYSEKQIEFAEKVLKENLFCNPHTCKVTGDLVDQVRFRILNHFNTNSNDYAVVFTANATAALKLAGECFNFGDSGRFYYCQENHTSVLGMREVVRTDDIFVLTKDDLLENLNENGNNRSLEVKGNSLVAFSAQCNFSGYKLPLSLISAIQENGLKSHGTRVRGKLSDLDNSNFYVCLDAASFVATNFLDLNKYPAEFVCVSFYKIFGYPTGVGALIVSKRGQQLLKKSYYGGGTVQISMTMEDFHVKRNGFTDHFEDGTLSFLGIAKVLEGFKTHERLITRRDGLKPIQRISNHVFQLAKYCYDFLRQLKHPNGQQLIQFYNHTNFNSVQDQGGIITFNILHEDGSYVGFAEVACIAAVFNVQLRTGCFCNPGACQNHLKLTNDDIRKQFKAGHICSDYNDLIDGLPTGAVRMSFGYMTRKKDVDKALKMIADCYLSGSSQRLELMEKCKSLPRALEHIPRRLKKTTLKKICIYPVKSCGSFEIKDSWEITERGFKYDRNWMIVDANGMAVTQKTHTRMCLIKPIIDIEAGTLELTFPYMKSIRVLLDDTVGNLEGKSLVSPLCQSKVCDDMVEGLDLGDEVAEWISDCLECTGSRLVRQSADRKTKNGENKDLNLVNQGQFLLLNKTSVEWLASKVESEQEDIDTTIDRFRANLIIETPLPLEENQFEEITIGGIQFKVDGFCKRCQMICIDQRSGQKTMEPLRTIAKEFKGKIQFGIYVSLIGFKNNAFISCKDDIKTKLK